MPDSDSGPELLAKAVEGDQESLAHLLEHHGAVVRRRIAGRIPKRWQSLLSEDDVMQQSYADAAMNISRFESRGDGSFEAWLTKLAQCNLRDGIRLLEAEKRGGSRRRIEPRSTDDSYNALHEMLVTTSSTPSRRAARDEAQSVMIRAIGQLPPTYRRVVELYDLQGMRVEEVAVELDRSPGAVFMQRARAHQYLAELMGRASKYFSESP